MTGRFNLSHASLLSASQLIFKAFFPILILTFSLAPPAEAQILERLRQAGERVADRVQERAEARVDSTIARAEARVDSTIERAEARADSTIDRAEGRIDQTLDQVEGRIHDTVDGADRRVETALLRAEDAVEGTIRCVVGDAECLERAREEEKEVVLIDPEGNNPALQQRAAPAGAGANVIVFHAGDVLVPKIDNVQVHEAPHGDAGVVGRAARTDEFVFLGDERDGFVMVQGATLSGWVRQVLLDRR